MQFLGNYRFLPLFLSPSLKFQKQKHKESKILYGFYPTFKILSPVYMNIKENPSLKTPSTIQSWQTVPTEKSPQKTTTSNNKMKEKAKSTWFVFLYLGKKGVDVKQVLLLRFLGGQTNVLVNATVRGADESSNPTRILPKVCQKKNVKPIAKSEIFA